ncbi:MAG: cytochrome c biogenesis protein CcdA [Ignavibacteria bacterium]|nr:cytochrome c biogenesis protein CcdA [Ignavibacteria bacterium]
MIDEIFTFLSTALSGNSAIAVFAAFGWGLASILLSPCHLSGIPLVIGFINSQGKITTGRTFLVSLVFGMGILVTIALIGIITASAGRLMGDIGAAGNYLVAGVFLIIGLYLMDIVKSPWDGANIKATKKRGVLAAFILGLFFGIGLGPCTFAFMAPVLGVVFRVSHTNLIYAVLLLLAFAIGHCSVIVLAGTLSRKVQEYLNWTENSKTVSYIKRACGVLVILGGIYMILSMY